MKKLILLGVVAVLLSVSGNLGVSSQQADNADVPQVTALEMPPSVIDGIEVPNDVLMYVQTEYQGYAVTKASKISRNGGELYRLLVDRDDQLYNNEIIYLLYDLNWQLVGEEKISPAPKEVKPAPSDDDKQEEKPKPEENQEGRGGGFIEEGEEPPGDDEPDDEESDGGGNEGEEPQDPPTDPPVEEPTPVN